MQYILIYGQTLRELEQPGDACFPNLLYYAAVISEKCDAGFMEAFI